MINAPIWHIDRRRQVLKSTREKTLDKDLEDKWKTNALTWAQVKQMKGNLNPICADASPSHQTK